MASKPSPARSVQSVSSPARSRRSGRMSSIINDSLLKHSVLSDNTDVDTIERSRWWEILGDQSQNVMEVLKMNNYDTSKTDEFASKGNDPNIFLNELGVEVLSQEKRNISLDLPESSDNETIHSIILPERRVFNQRENKTKPKLLGQLIGARETLANNQPRKSQGFDLKAAARQKQIFGQGPVKNTGGKIAALINISNQSNDEEDINKKIKRKYFDDTVLSKTKPAFPSALLDVSHDKTVPNKDKTIETKLKPLFGQNKVMKRNNMYAQFIASESEDELPEVEPKSFAIPKSSTSYKRPSSSVSRGRESSPASVTTDVEMDEWNMLPSSTMMEEQIKLGAATPEKRMKFGKLSEIHQFGASPYNTRSAKNKSSNVSNPANDISLSKTTNKQNRTSKFVEKDPIREENEDTLKENKTINKSVKEVNVTVDKKGKDTSKSINKTTSRTKEESINQIENKTKSSKEESPEPEDNEEMVLMFEEDNEQENMQEKNKESSAIDNIELIAQLTGQEFNENSSNKLGKSSTTSVTNKENKIVDETADEIYDEVLEEMGLNKANTELVNKENTLLKNKTSKNDQTVSLKENISKASVIHHESITFCDELENKKHFSQISKDLGADTNTENDQNINNTNIRQDVIESINKLQESKQSENKISKPELTELEILQLKNLHEEINIKKVANQSKIITQIGKTNEHLISLTSKTIKDNENEESMNQSKVDEISHESKDKEEDVESEKEISESEQEPEQSEEELNYDESEEEKEESEVIEEDENDPYDNDAINNSDIDNVSVIRNNDSQVKENQGIEEEMDQDDKDVINASEEQINESIHVEKEVDNDLEKSEEKDEGQECEDNMDVEKEKDDERDISQEQEISQDNDEHRNSQEVEDEQDNNQEIEDEGDNSQEIEDEQDNSQDIEDEQDNSQEIEDVQDNSQEIEDERDNSQEIEDERDNSHEIENEQDSSQEIEDVEDNSQEIEDERDNSHEIENEQDSSQEIEDEQDDSQEIEDQQDNSKEMEDKQDISQEIQKDTSQETENIVPKANEISKFFEAIDEDSETNVTHDTTRRNRQKRNASIIASPELARSEKSIRNSSFKARGRNTSVRKTVTLIQKPETEMASIRSSVGPSDGTKNSSAEGSGWDSHRVTKKTLRQTFGKDFTPRKSLRTLVMEKSAKRQTLAQQNQAVDNVPENVTEISMPQALDMEDLVESDHDVSKMTRQATLDMFLKKMKDDAAKKKQKAERKVKESLDMGILARLKSSSHNWAPVKSYSKLSSQPAKPKLKPKKLAVPLAHLPKGFLDDINYKPPKRFAPKNASWITNRLYKFLESKLEPKYDYRARVRAEKFVEKLYEFVQVVRRHDIAPQFCVDELKQEMAALNIVQTHFDFYEFFEDYLPMEIILSVVPDIKNKIKLPRGGVYTNILKQD